MPHGWKTFADRTLGYTISYPSSWRVVRDAVYPGFGPDHPITGTAFEIPKAMTRGTNLSSNLTYVSVESVAVPRGKRCDVKLFMPDPENVHLQREGGRTWIVGGTSDAGAGNFYEITAYALANSKPCLAVRYFIHSTNIGNYDPGTVREFDKAALRAKFDAIRKTLKTR